jgi:glucosyl-3-phosphoglycerate phosphatase
LRRVLVLRHGRTAWNAERRFQGHLDPPLDDVGRAQAQEVAAIMAAIRPALLVSSDAARAMQTAEYVGAAAGLPVRPEPRLRERGLGHWEGLTVAELEQRYPGEYARWVAGLDVHRPDGETRAEVAGRALAAFTELPDAATTVLVTHGATSHALCNALLGLGHEWHLLGPLSNCHWTELYRVDQVDGGPRWRLRGHNLGAPGSVVPPPAHAGAGEVSDADA